MARSKIVVLDFGSQYAHLIAKRFRMLGYYSEIALPSTDLSAFENCKGIVFSGGPSSVYDEKVPEFNSEILNLDIPILGLCYGHYIVQLGYNGSYYYKEVTTSESDLAQVYVNPSLVPNSQTTNKRNAQNTKYLVITTTPYSDGSTYKSYQ